MRDFEYVSWTCENEDDGAACIAVVKSLGIEPKYSRYLTDMGWVNLPIDDPRLTQLKAALASLGVDVFTRIDRVWEKKDRAAPWLNVAGGSMLEAGWVKGQKWDFSAACPECGAGATAVPPLLIKMSRVSSQGWMQYGGMFVVVSVALADAIAASELTGFVIEQVALPSRKVPDPRYRWLRITSVWSEPVERGKFRFESRCATCSRPAIPRFGTCVEPLHFASVPADAADFNLWQGSIVQELKSDWNSQRPTGGMPELIISQRAYQFLKNAGVKSLRCAPVMFDA